MSRAAASLTPDYFANLYASDPDPWRFATCDYERAKYEATLASLPRATYGSALEVGCSIGVLTRALAGRCADLLALDVAPAAIAQARRRCADAPWVRFAEMAAPQQWPAGGFDLIVLSEVVYYLDRRDIAALAARVVGALRPGGDVVLVHWLGETHYPLSGDDAAEAFIAEAGARLDIRHQVSGPVYRLDLLRRAAEAEAAPRALEAEAL